MTRDDAIARVGLTNVEAAEADNCELTCRIGGNGFMHDDPYLEYAGSTEVDYDGLTEEQRYHLPVGGCRLVVYYRASNEIEQQACYTGCDIWDLMDLSVDEYEIR